MIKLWVRIQFLVSLSLRNEIYFLDTSGEMPICGRLAFHYIVCLSDTIHSRSANTESSWLETPDIAQSTDMLVMVRHYFIQLKISIVLYSDLSVTKRPSKVNHVTNFRVNVNFRSLFIKKNDKVNLHAAINV